MRGASATADVRRHRTAIGRAGFSRPIRLALESSLIDSETTVFDYGCGRGDDLSRLHKRGITAHGWDPTYRPDAPCQAADVVNLGYVLNVIEDPGERQRALESAWGLSRRLLIVAVRLDIEGRDLDATPYSDGCCTKSSTFQKLYGQHELRDWLATTLERPTVPAAPGVVLVFRDDGARQSYLAARYQRRRAAPRVRQADRVYEQHRETLQPLVDFLTQRGRLPARPELTNVDQLEHKVGTIRQARSILTRVLGDDAWEAVAAERRRELLIYFALEKINGRPNFANLPLELREDVKAFFSSYRAACSEADRLLYATGQAQRRLAAMHESCVGKLTGNALYVHESALHHLPSVLRIYEGCARQYIGDTEGTNVIKLSREEPKISYLAYPSFRTDPHPILTFALSVPLGRPTIREKNYKNSRNPPILHRKEDLVSTLDRARSKYARLTRQEERWGLFDNNFSIGTLEEWNAVLRAYNAALRGHRLIRSNY